MDEIVALVDRDGVEVGSQARSVVRRDNLLHASTAVIVRDPAGRVFVHLRAATKDWAPSHHDCCAGGVLRPGELPEESARRELAEELGVRGVPLVPLGTSLFEDDTTRCYEHVFEAVWDGPLVYVDREVASGRWMGLEELAACLTDPDWPFVPDTRQLLARLAEEGTGDYGRLSRAG